MGIDLSPIWRPSVASDATVAAGLLEGLGNLDTDSGQVVIAVDHHAPSALPAELDAYQVIRFRGGPRLVTNPANLYRGYRSAGVEAGLYHHFGPWFRGLGSVTLVHDIVHVHDPAAFGPVEGRYLNLRKWSVKRSTRVLCPSRTSADELVRYGYRPDTSEIDVVTWGAAPLGSGDEPGPPSTLPRSEAPFALSVGRITERKQIPLAAEIVRRCSSTDRLVVVGPIENEEIASALRKSPDVHVLGKVSDSELDWLYRNAQATVLASRSEGFGLPLIEALQRGCPVLCNSLPVFMEVSEGLEGVAYFDANSGAATEAGAEALAALIDTGRPSPGAMRERFSWDNAAATVLESLHRAARSRR